VTPKVYLQYVTGSIAKEGLRQQQSLLETSLAVGLSGPGRLHDLIVNLEAMSPAEYARGGSGVIIDWGIAPSPFGLLLAARTTRGLCHLGFLDVADREAAAGTLRRLWPDARLRLSQATAVETVDRLWPLSAAQAPAADALRLQVRGTNFQLKVWQALLALEPGHSTSYGRLAQQLGSGGAARAIGGAVGANPVAWLIPCHRVLRAGGELGGYHWGVDRKRAMLAWERLHATAAPGSTYGLSPPRARIPVGMSLRA
jgi:AraC family transcriptional regulator of adaptative response/methylated-DNA-[protein]-cysteine methyltransferase